ncbi:MAG: flagellar hook-length control protein FliK [Gammaproteobacteria bacterium]
MPDIMLPQVSAEPVKAPAKSAKAAEPSTESQPEQGFSEVLQTRMEPEGEAKQAEGEAEPQPKTAQDNTAPAAEAAAAKPEGGKPLPAAGNPESAVLAAVTGTAAPDAAAVPETEAALPPGIALLFPDGRARPAAAGKPVMQSAQVKGQPLPQPGPLTTGAREALPESAQAGVTQAVREALAENAQTALPRPGPLAEFAAQVRALAAAQGQKPNLDAALERLMQTPAQPAAQAAAAASPQSVQGAMPQDALAGARAPLPTTLPSTLLDTPFRQPGWDQALSERVMWVANQKFQGAEIKLNPPQLGPIEVRVQLQHEQAHISFTAQHASVRDALEAALPRLREMFNANGFNLVDVNVSQHSFAEQQRQAQAGNRSQIALGGVDSDAEPVVHTELTRSAAALRGGIDLFA